MTEEDVIIISSDEEEDEYDPDLQLAIRRSLQDVAAMKVAVKGFRCKQEALEKPDVPHKKQWSRLSLRPNKKKRRSNIWDSLTPDINNQNRKASKQGLEDDSGFVTSKRNRESYVSSDDELPDIETDSVGEPASCPQLKLASSNSFCSCNCTVGRTLIMCRMCRLQSLDSKPRPLTSPPAKIARKDKDRHFLDSLVDITNHLSTDSESLESFEVYQKDGSINLNNLQLNSSLTCADGTEDGYESDCSLPSVKLYPLTRRSSFSSLESVQLYDDLPKRCSPPRKDTTNLLYNEESDSDDSLSHIKRRLVRVDLNSRPDICNQDSRAVTTRFIRRPSVFPTPPHPQLMLLPRTKKEDRDVVKMSEAKVNTIEGIIEEAVCNDMFRSTAASLIQDFTTTTQEPTDHVIQYLLRDILMDSIDMRRSYKTYFTLKYIQSIHPPLGGVPFDWETIEQAVENLRLPYGLQNANTSAAISNALALDAMVSYVELELLQRSLASEQRTIRSLAYKWLSAQGSYNKVSQVIQWIRQVIIFGEFDDMTEGFLKLNHMGTATTAKVTGQDKIPKILPMLQRLLDLSITVSRRPAECARRIGEDLLRVCKCLPSLDGRRLLLTSIVSPLLLFTLTQLLLEDQCAADTSDALYLADVIKAYFRCQPPCNALTPPPTPGDDDEEVVAPAPYTAESCEELAMFLWGVVSGYLGCAKGQLRYPLWRRELNRWDSDCALEEFDRKSLRELPAEVGRLRRRLTGYCHQISDQTNLYLIQIECMSDLC